MYYMHVDSQKYVQESDLDRRANNPFNCMVKNAIFREVHSSSCAHERVMLQSLEFSTRTGIEPQRYRFPGSLLRILLTAWHSRRCPSRSHGTEFGISQQPLFRTLSELYNSGFLWLHCRNHQKPTIGMPLQCVTDLCLLGRASHARLAHPNSRSYRQKLNRYKHIAQPLSTTSK